MHAIKLLYILHIYREFFFKLFQVGRVFKILNKYYNLSSQFSQELNILCMHNFSYLL